MEDKVKFKSTIRQSGNSKVVGIPLELLNFLDVGSENGTEVEMIGDVGKHGKFVAFWVKK